jgi:hypothetical protein
MPLPLLGKMASEAAALWLVAVGLSAAENPELPGTADPPGAWGQKDQK